jgi:hypothetical protein
MSPLGRGEVLTTFISSWQMERTLLLAFVGIVLAILIPTVIRSKAVLDARQALHRAQPAMDAVAEFHARKGRMPQNNAEAGAAQLKSLEGGFVKAIRVSEGAVEVEVAPGFWTTLDGKSLLLRPAVPAVPDGWIVKEHGRRFNRIEREYLPDSCRPSKRASAHR